MKNMPSLLGQKSIIEQCKIFEAHTTLRLWLAQNFPMNFSAVTTLAPPKFPNHTLNFITQTRRKFKAIHGKSGDGLNHSYN